MGIFVCVAVGGGVEVAVLTGAVIVIVESTFEVVVCVNEAGMAQGTADTPVVQIPTTAISPARANPKANRFQNAPTFLRGGFWGATNSSSTEAGSPVLDSEAAKISNGSVS